MGPGWALLLGLLLGVLGGAASEIHSLRYFHVAVREPSPGVPEFVSVGYVDGIPFVRYDSETREMRPQAEWMGSNEDQQYWDSQTQIAKGNQEIYRVGLATLRDRYNQSGRAQTLQRKYGCDILEDGSTRGVDEVASDGMDFISFDVETMTFTAADMAALVTKRKWEAEGTWAEHQKNYLENICVEWLKKYVSYGREVLERKEPPTVRVFGREEADGLLTLSCRAYGFYPRHIAVSWLRDGEVRDQDTERGSVVPNSDGTFYTWASITALPEEKDKYRCRVDHASLSEPRLYAWETGSRLWAVVLGLVIAVLAVIAVIAIVIFWRRRSGEKNKGYNVASGTDREVDGPGKVVTA